MSLISVLQTIESHLNLVPVIVDAAQAFKTIGVSSESTLTKIGQVIEVAAAVGEGVPNPDTSAVSSLVETIVQSVFSATTPVTPATTTK